MAFRTRLQLYGALCAITLAIDVLMRVGANSNQSTGCSASLIQIASIKSHHAAAATPPKMLQLPPAGELARSFVDAGYSRGTALTDLEDCFRINHHNAALQRFMFSSAFVSAVATLALVLGACLGHRVSLSKKAHCSEKIGILAGVSIARLTASVVDDDSSAASDGAAEEEATQWKRVEDRRLTRVTDFGHH
jgi:hypothetical protein